ncbi:MAG: hypothetical protein GX568_04505 [Candidatus Gastranaerophilales bacterium]|nr:hypothetical protein [Candidatus Gastranaerophilales bacterium]
MQEQTYPNNNNKQKFCFIGLSIGSAGSVESGISLIDRDLNLIRTDKVYNLSEIKQMISNTAPPENTVLCIDLPKNIMMLTGKWRIESKQTMTLNIKKLSESKKSLWKARFSDRGSELCKYFTELGMDVYRYNSAFTKTLLHLSPPYRSKSPSACKFLQEIIEERLHINNMPSNLLPLSTLNSLIGAYIAWTIGMARKEGGNIAYKEIGTHKGYPVVSALS